MKEISDLESIPSWWMCIEQIWVSRCQILKMSVFDRDLTKFYTDLELLGQSVLDVLLFAHTVVGMLQLWVKSGRVNSHWQWLYSTRRSKWGEFWEIWDVHSPYSMECKSSAQIGCIHLFPWCRPQITIPGFWFPRRPRLLAVRFPLFLRI